MAAATKMKNIRSVVESILRRVCVEMFKRLAIIPSNMSVNKPMENKVIA